MQSWNNLTWKGPLQITYSNFKFRAKFKVRSSSLGLGPVRFLVFQRMDSSQLLWAPISLFDHLRGGGGIPNTELEFSLLQLVNSY